MRTISTVLATATTAAMLTLAPAQASAPQPPSAPTHVTIFGSGSDDPGVVRLAWSAPKRTGSAPIKKYVVNWVGGRLSVRARAKSNEATVTGLDAGRYTFSVRAINRAGSSKPGLSGVAIIK